MVILLSRWWVSIIHFLASLRTLWRNFLHSQNAIHYNPSLLFSISLLASKLEVQPPIISSLTLVVSSLVNGVCDKSMHTLQTAYYTFQNDRGHEGQRNCGCNHPYTDRSHGHEGQKYHHMEKCVSTIPADCHELIIL